jgi:pantetheine-phosphate adenylyltransferase
MKKIIAIYPGTFDPLTYGHLDVLHRAAGIFSSVIIAVAESSGKNTLFTAEERMEMIKKTVKEKNIRIKSFKGLLVNYASQAKAGVIIRGLRAVSDFEYEFQMALTNRKISKKVETVFLMPGEKYSYISSTFVKEIAKYGGDVSAFVPPAVNRMLKDKFKKG